jgi:hypothetical protein
MDLDAQVRALKLVCRKITKENQICFLVSRKMKNLNMKMTNYESVLLPRMFFDKTLFFF